MEYKNLPTITHEKLIQRNFGHISHLKGSKMIDSEDKMLSAIEQEKYTVKKRDAKDIVIVTEKIDGMNAGVVKKNGYLYPINRKGYDCRTMGETKIMLKQLGEVWAQWVDDHYQLYDDILKEGERLVFENAIMKHTLKYKFKTEPVFLLAKYTADNKRINYKDLSTIANKNRITIPPLLNMGAAIQPETIISQYPKGMSGVRGEIEGIVYSYEHEGECQSSAKYVSNLIMGTFNPEIREYNEVKA